jgi:Anti-sigma-K factor rskA
MNGRELAAAYALGELAGAERDDFEARLRRDPALSAEVDATRAAMSALEALPEEAWPAAAATNAADAALVSADTAVSGAATNAADAAVVGADTAVGRAVADGIASDADPAVRRPLPAARRRRRFTVRPALAVAAIVLALAIGGAVGALVAGGGSSGSSTAPVAIVLRPLHEGAGAARGDISMPAAETMLLEVHGLPASGADGYYEVWLMNDAESLVPVASFRVGRDGRAKVEVPLPADPGSYRYFDVSRQTVGGGTAHSGDSVLRGLT